MDEEVKVVGYCETCGNEITNEDTYYIDQDGNRFCSIECVLERFGIEKIEV